MQKEMTAGSKPDYETLIDCLIAISVVSEKLAENLRKEMEEKDVKEERSD